MEVLLLSHTPNPEEVIATAAKLCYSKVGVKDLRDRLTPDKTKRFLDMLVDLGHESPLEHVSFTFAIEGVSRVLTHQLVRHRIASYSQQSQRYVKLDQFEYVVPPEIEKIPEAKKLFIKIMKEDQGAYDALVKTLTEKYKKEHYKKTHEVIPKNIASQIEKKAIEDARYVFPNACETKIVVTMNARSLVNFFRLRCCERAQWEIRNLANEMLKICREVAPTLFKNAGAPCVSGDCPEGKMSCGSPKRNA